jgi:hypothetical protein
VLWGLFPLISPTATIQCLMMRGEREADLPAEGGFICYQVSEEWRVGVWHRDSRKRGQCASVVARQLFLLTVVFSVPLEMILIDSNAITGCLNA